MMKTLDQTKPRSVASRSGMRGRTKSKTFEGIRQRGNKSFRINYKDAEGYRQWQTLTAKEGVLSIEDAAKVRRQRMADVDRGMPVSSKSNTVKFEELAADVVNDYLVNAYNSVDDIEARYPPHLLPVFGKPAEAHEIGARTGTRFPKLHALLNRGMEI